MSSRQSAHQQQDRQGIVSLLEQVERAALPDGAAVTGISSLLLLYAAEQVEEPVLAKCLFEAACGNLAQSRQLEVTLRVTHRSVFQDSKLHVKKPLP